MVTVVTWQSHVVAQCIGNSLPVCSGDIGGKGYGSNGQQCTSMLKGLSTVWPLHRIRVKQGRWREIVGGVIAVLGVERLPPNTERTNHRWTNKEGPEYATVGQPRETAEGNRSRELAGYMCRANTGSHSTVWQ